MALHGAGLPDFPWDSLIPVRRRAAEYPEGVVDLTIGTPVDHVPGGAREALAKASDAHGYPLTIGGAELREAIFSWVKRRRGVEAEIEVFPTIGSKEMVALLPSFLGLGSSAKVGFPRAAYPTYDVGARLAGAQPIVINTDADPRSWPSMDMLWLNSPGNPDGHVLSVEQLQAIVCWARENGVIVASDECYAELSWDVEEAPSLLDRRVCGDDPCGLLMLYSISKQSNMAGYRGAFLAGDPSLVKPMIEIRKHSGFLMPGPVQAAMAWALKDDAHVAAQKAVYEKRRVKLLSCLESAGLVNDPLSVAGLYIWAQSTLEGANGWDIVNACAELGIVVAPGDFYGEAGKNRVRISLTASDEAIDAAVERLSQLPKILAQMMK